jgi:hypothetical protein
VLQFAGGQDDVLYIDGVSRDFLIRDDQDQIAGYLARFEELRVAAVTGDKARDLLGRVAGAYEREMVG